MTKEEQEYRTCKYNTSTTNAFIGYCNHPKYHDSTGWRLVECKKLPCKDYKRKEEEEVIHDD